MSLAFDDKVILDRVSFVLRAGRMKIVLGASGAGKSTILRLILGLLRPDGGQIIVAGERIDEMDESALMQVRAGLGMVFQEGALFDSLTVRENVGYRLFEETDMPIAEVDARVREVLGFVGLAGVRRAHAVRALGWPAPPRGDCARAHRATRRSSSTTSRRRDSIRLPR